MQEFLEKASRLAENMSHAESYSEQLAVLQMLFDLNIQAVLLATAQPEVAPQVTAITQLLESVRDNKLQIDWFKANPESAERRS